MEAQIVDRTLVQATLVEPSCPYDVTLVGPESPHASVRTTVLPRLEQRDRAVAFVRSARPRYEVHRALGEGGSAQVVAAFDRDIGRRVAIKSLRPELQAPAHVARFVDEIRTVGALEHPNIVPIHDVGENEDGSLYFVMRCVEGETLESLIERLASGDRAAHAYWTFERRTHVFRQLLQAVAFAHDRGFVHRDIKPSNVMIGLHGEVFLMDWGIAKAVGASAPVALLPRDPSARATATHAGAVVGTPMYMSPEQARGEEVDVRSDVYALCVLFHELLCLRHYLAHCESIESVLSGVVYEPAPAASFVASAHQGPAPMDLSWFVRKGLSKEASQRFQSVREMIERLDARDDGRIPIQCPVTLTKRVGREALRALDRHPIAFTAALAASAIASLAGVATCVASALGL